MEDLLIIMSSSVDSVMNNDDTRKSIYAFPLKTEKVMY
jgi:hypothetical protein